MDTAQMDTAYRGWMNGPWRSSSYEFIGSGAEDAPALPPFTTKIKRAAKITGVIWHLIKAITEVIRGKSQPRHRKAGSPGSHPVLYPSQPSQARGRASKARS